MKSSGYFKKILILAVIVLSVPLTVFGVFRGIKYFSNAFSPPVVLSFLPVSATLPPDTTLRLMLDAKTNKVGFARVEVDFDKTKVNLSSEVVPTTTLKKVISLTTMSNANATGKITAIMGIDPADIASAPTGVFELLNFKITPIVSGLSQGGATFSVNNSSVQLVDMTPTVLNFTASSATFGLATATPAATSTATASSSPVITATASPTVTPTITPTAVPTCTPVACATPVAGCVYQGTNACSCGLLVCASPSPIPTPTPTASATAIPSGTPLATSTTTPTPLATSAPLAGDINGDGKVNLLDYIILFENFGKTSGFDSRADLNHDGKVNLLDYIILFENFGRTL